MVHDFEKNVHDSSSTNKIMNIIQNLQFHLQIIPLEMA